jgi:hypothetical protein
MQLEPARPEPFSKLPQHQSSLHLALAMDDGVVCVAAEPHAAHLTPQPRIERVVQEEIRQQRADYSPNAKGNFQFERVVEGWRSRAVLDLRRK